MSYTPSTEQVRRYWQYGANAWLAGVASDDDRGPDGSIGAEFDRWFESERRKAKAEGWDEGHATPQPLDLDVHGLCMCGAWNESECGCGNYGVTTAAPNPYREGER